MANSSFPKCLRQAIGLVALVLTASLSLAGPAHAVDVVTTHRDENGWQLRVNGEPFFVKGVVWGYTPRNENYSYNLWGESDEFIRKVLDYDFGLMRAAGVNAIRSFAMIPPQWVTYIYQEHGIRTVINPLMGRYGYNVGGKWVPFTDYSDELTRATLIADTLEIVERYKNVPGVLMFAFGNESNYGLSWSSFEIEDLPEGEQNEAKARYLYSLFSEVIRAGKKIAPNHPFTIVNGDIQYIGLIAELVPELDILGTNVYRGPSFTNLWSEVARKLDLPVLFFEFGSDAYNAREGKEDQLAQAKILKAQWQEIYNKSWGNAEEGNAIGGFVFEWRDEWWKYLQEENLDVQDTNASWSNQAYLFDWAPGKNNMNEEWFGITALGTPNSDGVYTARPRMAYDVLSEIWEIDPYQYKKAAVNQAVAGINMDYLELKGEVRQLKSESEEKREILRLTGGELRLEMVYKGEERLITEKGENGAEFSDGQMVFIDFGFSPTERIDGQFSINILGNVADKEPLEIQFGRRGLPFDIVEAPEGNFVAVPTTTLEDRERVEIYDFSADYKGEIVDIEAFYHTPRYHWKYEGDFFGLVREATDIEGADIWNAKAPSGVEFVGKGPLEGVTLLGGPEVYWGANPKVVLKYDFDIGGVEYTFIHSEDLARLDDSATATQATEEQSRQTTLYAAADLTDNMKLELGAIMSATEKVDDQYNRIKDGNIILDEIDFEDTLGFRAKLSFDFLNTRSYVAGHFAGVVADGGEQLREFGTQLPYSAFGNKNEYEAGVMMNFGNFMVFPRILYREQLEDALPSIPPGIDDGILFPGLNPRNRDDDPFAVLDNREARAAELMVTWDPTPETPFYAWDNDMRENAGAAFNIGANYTRYPYQTDAFLFFFEEGGTNAAFPAGLPSDEVWSLSSRVVLNPAVNARYIANLLLGSQQSTGNPDGGSRQFYELSGKMVLGKRHIISGYFKKDAWGPYDFHRQFNVTFPEQYMLDYSYLLDNRRDEKQSTEIGIRGLYRSLDENSPTDEFLDGDNDYLFQTVFYVTYRF